jgi:hypothetical protein
MIQLDDVAKYLAGRNLIAGQILKFKRWRAAKKPTAF